MSAMFTGKGKVACAPGRRMSGKGKRMSGRVGCSIMISRAAEKCLKRVYAAKEGPIGLQETGLVQVFATHDEMVVKSAVVHSLRGPNSGVVGLVNIVGFDRTFPTQKMSNKAGPTDFTIFLEGAVMGDSKAEGDGFK